MSSWANLFWPPGDEDSSGTCQDQKQAVSLPLVMNSLWLSGLKATLYCLSPPDMLVVQSGPLARSSTSHTANSCFLNESGELAVMRYFPQVEMSIHSNPVS